MRRVIIESPYGGTPKEVANNVKYARAAMRDCLLRGESPYASHMLYTQPGVLNDDLADERKLGMEAGFEWREMAEATIVYIDFGMSSGMKEGVKRAQKLIELKPDNKHVIEYRTLPESELVLLGLKK